LELSQSGKFLFAGCTDGTISMWNVTEKPPTLTQLGAPSAARTTVWISQPSPSRPAEEMYVCVKPLLAPEDFIRSLTYSNATRRLSESVCPDAVCDLALSSDGGRLFSGSLDGTIKVWDMDNGQVTRTLRGHDVGVKRLHLSADAKRLVSVAFDNSSKVWDL